MRPTTYEDIVDALRDVESNLRGLNVESQAYQDLVDQAYGLRLLLAKAPEQKALVAAWCLRLRKRRPRKQQALSFQPPGDGPRCA